MVYTDLAFTLEIIMQGRTFPIVGLIKDATSIDISFNIVSELQLRKNENIFFIKPGLFCFGTTDI